MTIKQIPSVIAGELNLKTGQVNAVIDLFEEGATVPFIARYRKEATGELDEVAVLSIRDRDEELKKLCRRAEAVLKSLEERELLTDDLRGKIDDAGSLTELEDIYLPYRPKRKTRASVAREAGLEPLALLILKGSEAPALPEAVKYVDSEKEIASPEEALKGASDIIAETAGENAGLRTGLRELFQKRAVLTSSVVKSREKEAAKYRDYFDWTEKAAAAPAHRILAVFRGAEEGFLRFHILPDEDEALGLVFSGYPVGREPEKIKAGSCREVLKNALTDSYSRILAPSMENWIRNLLKEKADSESVRVFGLNLEELLMEPPLGQKRVLAVDPGLRTGCKVVCLDSSGKLLVNDTIYPLPPANKTEEAANRIREMVAKYRIEAVAVGNGTGGREALAFLEGLGLPEDILLLSVSESGASVYSASEAARREFPDYDLTVRGAVSIGRRLMDPLAELVKIEPKAIGVGQYQHDVDQKLLKQSLDDVVESCVNRVGVEVNTASSDLLKYVSGLSSRLAESVIKYRDENGPFRSREDLKKVSGMGQKSFEQAAGFLRIRGAENPLDNSAVHPESYHIAGKMASDLSVSIGELTGTPGLKGRLDPGKYIGGQTGLPTVMDIIAELEKPGRDPREQFSAFSFSSEVSTVEDLREGMVLPGIITNVTNFGAFVDIGVHQDGLIHISEMADRFVKDPMEIVRVNQKVMVRVTGVDLERKRISLSLKGL